MATTHHIGQVLGSTTHRVEAGRLRHFAIAVGNNDPVYRDPATARAAGFPNIPVLPTFAFCLELDRDDPFDFLKEIDVELARILHAEQAFTYHTPLYAEDIITFTSRISDVFDKKEGALTFVEIAREGHKANGTLAVSVTTTLVVRNGHD